MNQRVGNAWLLLALFAASGAGQTTPTWTQKSPQTSPPARFQPAMAYDAAHGEVILFGGLGAKGYLNDTWVWDGTNWTQKSPQTSPPSFTVPVMAYDGAHGQVVLFGAALTNAPDTWAWNGTNWLQEPPHSSPLNKGNPAMVYDSARSQITMILTEGCIFSYFDTWVWDGSNWLQHRPQASPEPLTGYAMTYDANHSQIVLFGGKPDGCVANPSTSDTWAWDGTNWLQASPQTSPPPRYLHSMAYDAARRQVILFSGAKDVNSTPLSDTWGWDGSNWTQLTPTTSPPGTTSGFMAYDSSHAQVVLFESDTAQTWTWGIPPVVIPPAPAITTVVSASSFGGSPNVAPGSWVEIYGSNLASGTRGWTGADFSGNNAPTSLDGVKVQMGGQAAFVDYISPSQVNAQLPSNISTGGISQLTVTNANGASAPVNVMVNTTEPGLLAPASFKIAGNQYVVAILPDGNYVLPTGAIAGVNSRPAKPGETVVMYGVGFGPVTPAIPAGEIATQTNKLSNSLQILFGKTPANLPYFGLAPGFVGLYQFNVVVPAVPDNDLVPLTLNLGGVPSAQSLFTDVHG